MKLIIPLTLVVCFFSSFKTTNPHKLIGKWVDGDKIGDTLFLIKVSNFKSSEYGLEFKNNGTFTIRADSIRSCTKFYPIITFYGQYTLTNNSKLKTFYTINGDNFKSKWKILSIENDTIKYFRKSLKIKGKDEKHWWRANWI